MPDRAGTRYLPDLDNLYAKTDAISATLSRPESTLCAELCH